MMPKHHEAAFHANIKKPINGTLLAAMRRLNHLNYVAQEPPRGGGVPQKRSAFEFLKILGRKRQLMNSLSGLVKRKRGATHVTPRETTTKITTTTMYEDFYTRTRRES